MEAWNSSIRKKMAHGVSIQEDKDIVGVDLVLILAIPRQISVAK